MLRNHPSNNSPQGRSTLTSFSREKAFQKIKYYCAYQERSHREVKEKLYSYGLLKKDVEPLLSQLIEENFLNEEKFAQQFAGGKFRMKHWGKIKIRYELQQKQVSEYCIRKALASIDNEEYQKTFEKLASRKLATLKSEKNIFTRKRKLQDFLLQKGYEPLLIHALNNSQQ